jgi:hypothetical protein
MYLQDGKSVLVADTPDHFSSAVIKLYQDQRLWEQISAGGITAMEEHFSFAAARNALINLLGG